MISWNFIPLTKYHLEHFIGNTANGHFTVDVLIFNALFMFVEDEKCVDVEAMSFLIQLLHDNNVIKETRQWETVLVSFFLL